MVPENSPPEKPVPNIGLWLSITTAVATCVRLLLEVVRAVR